MNEALFRAGPAGVAVRLQHMPWWVDCATVAGLEWVAEVVVVGAMPGESP